MGNDNKATTNPPTRHSLLSTAPAINHNTKQHLFFVRGSPFAVGLRICVATRFAGFPSIFSRSQEPARRRLSQHGQVRHLSARNRRHLHIHPSNIPVTLITLIYRGVAARLSLPLPPLQSPRRDTLTSPPHPVLTHVSTPPVPWYSHGRRALPPLHRCN